MEYLIKKLEGAQLITLTHLIYLQANQGNLEDISTKELAMACGNSRNITHIALQRLCAKKIIERSQGKKGRHGSIAIYIPEDTIKIYNKYHYNVIDNEMPTKCQQNANKMTTQEETPDVMIQIWNKVFECSLQPIRVHKTHKTKAILCNLFKSHFNSNLEQWREYAVKVNSSKFLMGEIESSSNFKASWGWLIKEEVIEKVQNGVYGEGDRELDINNIPTNLDLKKEEVVNTMDRKILEYIRLNIDEEKERAEFIEYVTTLKTAEEDEYGILKIIRHIPHYNLFNSSEYKVIRESLYENYVMKKYLKITKSEVRERIRNMVQQIIDKKGKNGSAFEALSKKNKEIEYLDLSNKGSKMSLLQYCKKML